MDVGIVIPLAEEFNELHAQIKESCKRVEDQTTGRSFYLFSRPGGGNEPPYGCVATFVGEMGPTESALVATRIIARWNPPTLVLIGLGAGIHTDVKVGDVVVATQVDSYLENSKALPSGKTRFEFQLSGKTYRPHVNLLNAARHLKFSHAEQFSAWTAQCAAEIRQLLPNDHEELVTTRVIRPEPSMVDGHVASGPTVGAAQPFTEWLHGRDRKYLALEMEGGGFMTALYQGACENRALVLRGISDYGDDRKKELDQIRNGALRQYAIRNAIGFLWCLMDTGSLPRAPEEEEEEETPSETRVSLGTLSDAAREVLLAATASDGQVFLCRAWRDPPVQAGGKELGDVGDPRSEAKYKAAVQSLTHAHLLEPGRPDRGEFRVTDEGWVLADRLKPTGQPTEPQDDATGPEIALAKLPSTRPDLFGRDQELADLDAAWNDPQTNVVTFVAFGGVGKTALVNVWLERMRKDHYRGARRVLGWSFYSQGTSEDHQASGDEFLAAALKWFGGTEPPPISPWEKGERLAHLVRKQRTLLILDGLEPLQYPPGEMDGRVRDPGVQTLLRELAVDNPGLCVVSTRIAVDDLKDYETGPAKRVDLEDLSKEAGAKLLAFLGVEGSTDELQETAHEFGGHALALTLLGRYLAVAHDGDVRRRDKVPKLTAEPKEGGHARRVMQCYERWFGGRPESCILRMLGLFDRPAVGGAIDTLRAEPAIPELTDKLHGLSDADWRFALQRLRENGLLAKADENAPDTLDCHPLIREHFADKVQNDYPDAWREGHNRLYEYFKGLGSKTKFPDTIEQMAPLYAAVTHGCHAGRHAEVLREVYVRRIQRGDQYFSTSELGAFGADLAALYTFFDPPWRHPVGTLAPADRAHVLELGGFRLRALGRLVEAVDPVNLAMQSRIERREWREAAGAARNLTHINLTLGRLSEALECAYAGVESSDRSDDAASRLLIRVRLASVLQHMGRLEEAGDFYGKAERILEMSHHEPADVMRGGGLTRYCELFLDRGQTVEARTRAQRDINWLKDHPTYGDDPNSVAFAHSCIAWSYVAEMARRRDEHICKLAASHARAAVEYFRRSGHRDYLPRGFLVRACQLRMFGQARRNGESLASARLDLDEAMAIATRGQMRLYEADAHLEYARLEMALGNVAEARTHLETANTIIEDTGYHRRDAEVLIETARLEMLEGDQEKARHTLAAARAKVDEMGCHRWDPDLAELAEKLK